MQSTCKICLAQRDTLKYLLCPVLRKLRQLATMLKASCGMDSFVYVTVTARQEWAIKN